MKKFHIHPCDKLPDENNATEYNKPEFVTNLNHDTNVSFQSSQKESHYVFLRNCIYVEKTTSSIQLKQII